MNIVINCERMKYIHTGLFHFCLNLTKSLQLTRKDNYPALKIFAPKDRRSYFNSLEVIPQHPYHKLFKLSSSHFDLWHETSQAEKYFPYASNSKKVLTIHDLNVLLDETKSLAKKKRYIQQLQRQIDHSDAITTISNYSLNAIHHHLKIGDKPVKVIYNGSNVPTDPEFIKPGFIQGSVKYLFSVGTVVRKKNFHTLPGMLKNHPRLKLIIAGDIVSKEYHEEIMQEARKHKVTEQVIFPGGISEGEKWWLYKNMDAFIFPSIAEGFGLPVIEAMHFGKPVILSNETSLPEIGGQSAYYFNSFDPEEMSKTLDTALNDFHSSPGKSNEVSNHAQTFNWNKAAEQYWQVYNTVLGLNV